MSSRLREGVLKRQIPPRPFPCEAAGVGVEVKGLVALQPQTSCSPCWWGALSPLSHLQHPSPRSPGLGLGYRNVLHPSQVKHLLANISSQTSLRNISKQKFPRRTNVPNIDKLRTRLKPSKGRRAIPRYNQAYCKYN